MDSNCWDNTIYKITYDINSYYNQKKNYLIEVLKNFILSNNFNRNLE